MIFKIESNNYCNVTDTSLDIKIDAGNPNTYDEDEQVNKYINLH